MALAVEWLPEEWPEGIPNLKQLLVGSALLTTSILLLFGCGNRNLRTVWLILGRVAALVPQDPPTSSGRPRCTPSFRPERAQRDGAEMRTAQGWSTRRGCAFRAR